MLGGCSFLHFLNTRNPILLLVIMEAHVTCRRGVLVIGCPVPLPLFIICSLFSLIVTIITYYLFLFCQTALSVGASLSPTSLGFSAQLLGEVGELTTPIGQLICTAAVIDDVLSLLLLAEVQALGDEDPKVRVLQ